ncbi:hypothetical protein SH528x_006612 [Novipirellula sp. SH528]|uniref:hypothetical protein n=1 Tax=Novipirellula sp. SH528 TaxID=3454466 RepID=UPI003F9EC5C8
MPQSFQLSFRLILLPFACLFCVQSNADQSAAKSKITVDGWSHQETDESDIVIMTKQLVMHPAAEPQPAMKYRLIPSSFDAMPGNAALYYMKAAGFFEQQSSRHSLWEFFFNADKQAKAEGKTREVMRPYVWLSTAPNDLPIDDVKAYLEFTSFQMGFLQEAASRRHFDLNRNIKLIDDDMFGYLLPEIQNFREVARNQSLRCRVAIAEGRVDDAIEILGQQFAMARHIGSDDFLVSGLVGNSIASIAWNDALYLLQHAQTPNLYWAFAAMPTPLIDMEQAFDVERELMHLQLKLLAEINETPRSEGYWQDYIDRLLPKLRSLEVEFNLPTGDPVAIRATIEKFIKDAYPSAKTYLIDQQKLQSEQVEKYPTEQVVFLAMVRFLDRWRDEYYKWTTLPYWQIRTNPAFVEIDKRMQTEAEAAGLFAKPVLSLSPLLSVAAKNSQAGCERNIAMLRTIEAIRMYAAAHDSKLPPSLEALDVPAGVDPFTGKLLQYERNDDHAVLKGFPVPGMQHQLILRMAE